MITKTQDQYAHEIASQIISSTNGLMLRLIKTFDSGLPADDSRKLPALDAATLKEALGADAVKQIQTLIDAFNK